MTLIPEPSKDNPTSFQRLAEDQPSLVLPSPSISTFTFENQHLSSEPMGRSSTGSGSSELESDNSLPAVLGDLWAVGANSGKIGAVEGA